MMLFSSCRSYQIKMDVGQVVVALVVLCTEIMQITADVIATSQHNDTTAFQSVTAAFGSPPDGQMQGLLVVANPIEACGPIQVPPLLPNVTGVYFALIKRGSCNFDKKVYNAQQARYMGAIVYNDEGNVLTTMSGSQYNKLIYIPSVFVGKDSGETLQGMNYSTGYTIELTPGFVFPFHLYLIPFASIVGICFIVMLCFMIAKYVRDQRRQRKARLSRDHLKKLPIKKFKKGDEYDICAICLDDYEEGQKLRILPCNHAYHCKCIDPWLTNNRRTCPICKRKVIPPGMADSDEESDSEAGDAPNENTPLLSSMHSDNLSDHGAVGGLAETATPPPSPMTSVEGDDYPPIDTLIKVESDSESSGSFPLEEAKGNIQDPPNSNVLSVTVHSENEIDPSTSSAPKV
ncbi:E3 ubiquitin-protein ligase RNF13-like isoform X1 [Strongylocentrotus purpuratus]|uniref:RING-type E3 ubiquitin transferase n=1 Tax=Strongylocentrotus purpuratus TaxID=7668 RepID=A0A7M7NJT0_STRPU|nr:E3 ubiquitin-protein ligase RNF13-like isoform X1 [Strongylocentrotus purpuratus]